MRFPIGVEKGESPVGSRDRQGVALARRATYGLGKSAGREARPALGPTVA
jgi:hypothetical protein